MYKFEISEENTFGIRSKTLDNKIGTKNSGQGHKKKTNNALEKRLTN